MKWNSKSLVGFYIAGRVMKIISLFTTPTFTRKMLPSELPKLFLARFARSHFNYDLNVLYFGHK